MKPPNGEGWDIGLGDRGLCWVCRLWYGDWLGAGLEGEEYVLDPLLPKELPPPNPLLLPPPALAKALSSRCAAKNSASTIMIKKFFEFLFITASLAESYTFYYTLAQCLFCIFRALRSGIPEEKIALPRGFQYLWRVFCYNGAATAQGLGGFQSLIQGILYES